MTEKEIRKLNRQDLLILLAEQKERVDMLEAQLKAAEEKLENRRLAQEECGSMAEAALRFHDVFRAVDEAAAMFAENVRIRQQEQEESFRKLESENTEKYGKILQNARQEAEQILADANTKAAQIITQAEAEADRQAQCAEEIISKAQKYVADEMEKIEQRWAEIREKIESMSEEYIWLRGIINREDDASRQTAGQIIQDAQERAQEIVSQAQEQAEMEMERIDSRWNGIYDRIRGMEKEYSWLKGIINRKAGEKV